MPSLKHVTLPLSIQLAVSPKFSFFFSFYLRNLLMQILFSIWTDNCFGKFLIKVFKFLLFVGLSPERDYFLSMSDTCQSELPTLPWHPAPSSFPCRLHRSHMLSLCVHVVSRISMLPSFAENIVCEFPLSSLHSPWCCIWFLGKQWEDK